VNSVQFTDGGSVTVKRESAAQKISAGFKSINPDHRWRYQLVSFEDMVIDPRIQRSEEAAEINQMVANWEPAAVGTVILSRRGDGTLVVLDGQQRRAAGLKVGHTDQVQAIVHEGLMLTEEAKLFLLLNTRRSVNAWTNFRIARTAGDPVAQAIGLILDEMGITLGGPTGFSAVVMARRVARRQGGLAHLQWALRQVQSIYDPAGEGGVYDGRVIEAFALLFREHGEKIDEHHLQKKLAQAGGGVDGLIGHGHTVQIVTPCKIHRAIAQAIVNRYNAGKSKGSVHALPSIV